MKNSLAPINKIPPEVLSIVPDYYRKDLTDRDLIVLTHVCHRWRDTFISRTSLWTRFDFTNVDKTRTYIQRSQSSSLKFHFGGFGVIDEALTLVTPHIRRLKSLTIDAPVLPSVLRHLRRPTPLIEKLDIKCFGDQALDNALFNGDLSSLRELRLHGVVAHFPWTNLSNLRVIDLKSRSYSYETTKILDLFVSAPLLHIVSLWYPIPVSSDVPPQRTVPLRHLKVLTIMTDSSPSILLHHLLIPAGASVILEFPHHGDESPFPDYFPERFPNSNNLSQITAINLPCNMNGTSLRLSGPSGSLRLLTPWRKNPNEVACTIFPTLGPVISTTERLAIFGYKRVASTNVEDCPIFQTLSSANHLQTLVLADCYPMLFAKALDPSQNPSNLVLCSNLKKLVLYVKHWSLASAILLIRMAKNRASRGAKFSSITVIEVGDPALGELLSRLKEHVTHVEHRSDDARPAWDDVPGESGG